MGLPRLLAALTLVVLSAAPVAAELRLPAVIGDHMVIQRNAEAQLWGWADPGDSVSITPSWDGASTVVAEADERGKWTALVQTPDGGGPYEIELAARQSLKLRDILVGEVWVCSGQSNMQWSLRQSAGGAEAIDGAQQPEIRLFSVARTPAGEPRDDCEGQWARCTPETAASFSAVAYYFGRDLSKSLGVPIGLVHTSWGGSSAEAWMPREALEARPAYTRILEGLERNEAALSAQPRHPTAPGVAFQRVPTALYNGMLAPLLPLRIRGVIWYQGEANTPQAQQYRQLFADLISSWRDVWGQGDFPFYFVQLAPFNYARTRVSHELRDAQRHALALPNTGMAVTLDIGNPRDIHPKNKKDVGERLARWARARTYGQSEVEASGPLYRSHEVDGDRVRLTFDHVGSGLAVRDGGDLTDFTIAGEDRHFVPAVARIDGETLVVTSEWVPRPRAVRFAWSNAAEPNFMNKEGLPASSFRTDNWELVTALAAAMKPRHYTIPIVDLDGDAQRQVIVDREAGQYLGHPTTVLLEDGRTIIAVYPKGHGRGAIVMKRSSDGGRTWSERLPVPESWATSQEVPTLYRVVDPEGNKRLIMFSGLHPIRLASSEDDGATWTELEPIGDFGGIVAMGDVMPLKNGRILALFHDDGRFIAPKPTGDGRMILYKTISADGGRTWTPAEIVGWRADAGLCEPGLVRSPDGTQIAMLLRENYRKYNSMIQFSDDEAESWSDPRELPAALTGDRHQIRYALDGRLVITFRDTAHVSPTKGDWVAWVGTYEDLRSGREGQYRVRLKDNHNAWDCAYSGILVLPDGTFVLTTYGHWTEGEPPYILSVRFRLDELDARARGLGARI